MTREEPKYTCKNCYYNVSMVGLDSDILINWCGLYCSPKINLDDGPACKYFKPKEAES